MNILELSKPFNHGGMAEHVVTLSVGLSKLGHQVTVASRKGDHLDKLEQNGVLHVPMSFTVKNPFGFLKCAHKLKKIIKQKNIDIVHCHYRACALYMRYLQVFCGVKVPFVWSNHLFEIPSDFLHRKFTFKGEKVIAVSNELKQNLVKNFDISENDIVVVNNGIDPEYLKEPSDNERENAKKHYGVQGKTVCSVLGRLVPVKGHKIAIEVLDALKQRKDLVFLFAGNGEKEYKEELIKEIQKRNLTDRILLVGQTDSHMLLSASDVMILPSIKEGFPLSVIESFACKVPVVRTKTSGYDETKDCVVGVEIGNVNEFANELDKLLSDKEKIKELTQRAYELVLENWTTEVMTKKILGIYKEVLDRK